jgi:tetratricopeptide (TPR) repeat protein
MYAKQPKRKLPERKSGRKSTLSWVILILFAAVAFFVTAGIGAIGGYQSGLREFRRQQTFETVKSLQEQYVLGVQDMEAGHYDLARQRFEHILDRDPAFPGAAEKLVQVVQVLYATATPTAIPPTITPTPTPDLRPVQDLLNQAQNDYAQGKWTGVIDVLLALRKADASFHVVDVDSLLYRALRYRGLQKIREEANLEGGMYDLSLAERFGPLDAEADNWRNLARLYVIGLSFWEVYPEQAVFYFSQVAAAAPGLRDGTGWTASGRYLASMVQYGDWLAAREDWCAAEEKYNAALSMGADNTVSQKADEAQIKCSPPTDTPEPSPKPSATPTNTFVPGVTPADTPTATIELPTTTEPPSPSDTPTVPPQPSATPSPTQEIPPTPTDTSPPPPPATDTPTAPADAPQATESKQITEPPLVTEAPGS